MKLTTEEITLQKLSAETLESAIQQVKMNGFVVFESVLPKDLISELHTNFIDRLTEHSEKTDPNRGRNRHQMHLPFADPFCDESVIANPIALLVIDSLLGANCHCHYLASDTPLPGSEHQRVHSDIHQLFPEADLILPAYSIVLNIPLVDFTIENGAVEIWPGGTHYMPRGVDMLQQSELMHSEQVLMPAGSLLIRDMRMWHRGTPNRSDHARPNLALIYARWWLRTHYPQIEIPRSKYETLSDRAKQIFRFEKIID